MNAFPPVGRIVTSRYQAQAESQTRAVITQGSTGPAFSDYEQALENVNQFFLEQRREVRALGEFLRRSREDRETPPKRLWRP